MNDGFSAWPTLAFTADSTPYLGFEDYGDGATHGGTIQVRKYAAGVWTLVGPNNISDGYYNDHVSFAIGSDDTLYIAYSDSNNS